jgi:hypothetical protein
MMDLWLSSVPIDPNALLDPQIVRIIPDNPSKPNQVEKSGPHEK